MLIFTKSSKELCENQQNFGVGLPDRYCRLEDTNFFPRNCLFFLVTKMIVWFFSIIQDTFKRQGRLRDPLYRIYNEMKMLVLQSVISTWQPYFGVMQKSATHRKSDFSVLSFFYINFFAFSILLLPFYPENNSREY